MIYLNKKYLPFFSVVITTYNRKDILPRAVNSLREQSEEDWEGIIVDDGSTDNTTDYVKNIIDNDNRFRYVYQKNKGVAAAKNLGIMNAAGLYTTFLDSDDKYLHDHLERRKLLLNQNPDVDFLHGGHKVIGDRYVPDMLDQTKMIDLAECKIGGTFFIKSNVLKFIGGFDLVDYADDSILFQKALDQKLNIAETDAATYIYYREDQKSITNK